MVGKDNMRHSHATHDLYNAIDAGNFPVWNFAVQVRMLARSCRKSDDASGCTLCRHRNGHAEHAVGLMVVSVSLKLSCKFADF